MNVLSKPCPVTQDNEVALLLDLEDLICDSSLENLLIWFISETPTYISQLTSVIILPGMGLFKGNIPPAVSDLDVSWMDKYKDHQFYEFFRMKRETLMLLLETLIRHDVAGLICKKYRGGNYPVLPEKSLLIVLYYMAHQDTLNCIGDRFKVATSTVMRLVNVFLFIIIKMKNDYIFWPKTQDEINHVVNSFERYPGVLGAVDGSHINIKVPVIQQDSYCDRYLNHSVNLMAVCTAEKVFTYIFVGFPGSAHDSRVLNNSFLMKNIEKDGPESYGLGEDHHLIGDSAFGVRTWLMVPYKDNHGLNVVQKHHNFCLSSARVAVENVFGILKGRWRRLLYINTYNVSKAIEIITASCILHNFCILNHDQWMGPTEVPERNIQDHYLNDNIGGREKRDHIAMQLFEERIP